MGEARAASGKGSPKGHDVRTTNALQTNNPEGTGPFSTIAEKSQKERGKINHLSKKKKYGDSSCKYPRGMSLNSERNSDEKGKGFWGEVGEGRRIGTHWGAGAR